MPTHLAQAARLPLNQASASVRPLAGRARGDDGEQVENAAQQDDAAQHVQHARREQQEVIAVEVRHRAWASRKQVVRQRRQLSCIEHDRRPCRWIWIASLSSLHPTGSRLGVKAPLVDSLVEDSLDERHRAERGFDFAAELGVADGFEQPGEIGAGGEAVVDQVGAVDRAAAG